MSFETIPAARLRAIVLVAILLAGGGGYWIGTQREGTKQAADTAAGGKVLYYYDPMFPDQKFDRPGKSPFMDMELMPKYANDGGGKGGSAPAVTIDPAAQQNLGLRTAAAKFGTLAGSISVTGSIDFNQRDLANIQARSGGFVQRTYGRAPGDVIQAGAPIADIQLPEWGGAQAEFLSVKRLGNPALTAAARQRLRLLGMPESVIVGVERTGRAGGTITVTSPIGGVIQTLDARTGVTLANGQTLAQVTGLGTVWLNAAVPEAQAGQLRVGQSATATLTAFPAEVFAGSVIAILPTAQADTRTLTVRIELANRGGRLRPGMFASVSLGGDAKPALLVPSEAVIRTGARTLVMLASKDGRYHPAEIRTGRESGGQTEILQGLTEGEQVVVSGQFLIDSEASLTGIPVRTLASSR